MLDNTQKIGAAVAISNEHLLQEARSVLRGLPVRVLAECANVHQLESFRSQLMQQRPGLLLLDTGLINTDLSEAVRSFRSRLPEMSIIALHPKPDPDVILSAMRAGANEFIYPPLQQHLPAALDRMAEAAPVRAAKRALTLGFVSVKGGCGASTIACHMADQIRKISKRDLLLLDFDLNGGLTSFLMKSPGRYSLLDALDNLGRLDGDLWNALLVSDRQGVRLLPEIPGLHGATTAVPDLVRLLKFARAQHDFVLVDFGSGMTAPAFAAFDEVDELFLVATLDVPGLHATKAFVRQLRLANADLNRTQLILNRVPKTKDIAAGEIEKMLDRQLYAMLPDDTDALTEAYLEGGLVGPNSRLGKHITALATKIAGAEEKPVKKNWKLF